MDKKQFLKILQSRLPLLHPQTRASLGPWFDKAVANVDNAENASKLQKLQEEALTDPAKLRTLNALRILAVENFVKAQANALSFFEDVVLADDEEPYAENNTKQEITVRFIGEDGPPQKVQARRDRTATRLDLRIISTDMVEYVLRDIYKGKKVGDQALANIDLSYDLSMKKNAELWALVKTAVGAFNLSGRKANRTYVPHSTIVAGNLPTTNLITLSGNSNSSKFRFDVVRAAIQWCLNWGSNATSLGEIKPVTIFVPSSDVGAMLDEINVNSPDNAIVNEIIDVGHVIKLAGRQFNLIGDATLDPAGGRCYVRTNVPLGKHLSKPSQAQMFPESPSDITAEMRMTNKGKTFMSEPYGAYIPSTNLMGVLGIQYRNPQ